MRYNPYLPLKQALRVGGLRAVFGVLIERMKSS